MLLSGTFDQTVTTPVDLTSVGAIDWGRFLNGSTDSKATGSGLITFTQVGSGGFTVGGSVAFTWSDGTPNATGSSTSVTGFFGAVNEGWSVSLPADGNIRTCTVYCEMFFGGTATMTAHLSGAGAPADVSHVFTGADFEDVCNGNFTYQAAPGETLTITFLNTTSSFLTMPAVAVLTSTPPVASARPIFFGAGV